jgi:hypothetical protein
MDVDAAVSADPREFQTIAIFSGLGILISLLALDLNRGFFDCCLGLWQGEVWQGEIWQRWPS